MKGFKASHCLACSKTLSSSLRFNNNKNKVLVMFFDLCKYGGRGWVSSPRHQTCCSIALFWWYTRQSDASWPCEQRPCFGFSQIFTSVFSPLLQCPSVIRVLLTGRTAVSWPSSAQWPLEETAIKNASSWQGCLLWNLHTNDTSCVVSSENVCFL